MSTSVPHNPRPVIGSLLSKLQKSGFTLVSVNDYQLDGTDRERRQFAKGLICIHKRTELRVDNSEGISKTLFLVLGSEPAKIVRLHSLDTVLDSVVQEFQEQWAGKVWPTK